MLTQVRLKELLEYSAGTGQFLWKMNRRSVKAGAIAGTRNSDGYLHIGVDGKYYKAHRLAWLYIYGEFPDKDMQLDHINGRKDDNAISNLRLVTPAVNSQNQRIARIDNACNFLGVSFYKSRGLYVAKIHSDGKQKHIGYFITPEEAYKAYLEAKRELHEGCTI